MRHPTEPNQEPSDGHRCSQPPSPQVGHLTSAVAADVQVVGGGTVFMFMLQTGKAHRWVGDYVSAHRQMWGDGLVVEWRYAAALAEGMQRDGLVVVEGGQ